MEVVHNINQIELDPGDKLYFERDMATGKAKISATYVGTFRNQYLLSELPVSNKGPLFQHADIRCTVRFVARGAVYGFTSSVANIIHSPVPLIFIAFPNKIEKMNLRKEGRFKVFIPVRLGFEEADDKKDRQGTIVDLSNSGCRVITQIFCDTGDRLTIKLKMQEDGMVQPFSGIVRNARPSGVDNYELGIEFTGACSALGSFIQKLQGYLGAEGNNTVR
jgi:c-di-GMP-binding flagellar brake protein YcgR